MEVVAADLLTLRGTLLFILFLAIFIAIAVLVVRLIDRFAGFLGTFHVPIRWIAIILLGLVFVFQFVVPLINRIPF